jgi:D-cysteine desulfhydrase
VPSLGAYPTPVMRMVEAARAANAAEGVELWCKRDDLTSTLYGGNKVRKLERLLAEALAKGAERVVTVGAVGSHHVLATALYGRQAGLAVEAVLAPQPWTPHVEEVARVGATLGFTAFPVRSYAAVPLRVARRLGARGTAYFIPPGGSSVTGSLGYVDAATELAGQIARGELPRPTAIVVALGSGGTVAGMLVGLARAGLLDSANGAPPIEVLAVQVVDPPYASGPATLALALAIKRRLGDRIGRASIATLSRALRVVSAQLGEGYGHPTAGGALAAEVASRDGLVLDATYTAKAFAAALDEVRARPKGSIVLYWHTLAAPGPFAQLLAGAPPVDAVDPKVRALMVGAP